MSHSPASIPTLGDLLSRSDARLFAGRAGELQLFSEWLSVTDPPTLLNVSGVAGIGKSVLLRAFARRAKDAGRLVSLVDGRRFAPTPAEFMNAVIGSTRADAFGLLNALRPVILIDTFDQLTNLTPYLQDEFLARLKPDVKVVIAGRRGLDVAWAATNDAWNRLVRPLRLGGLPEDDSRLYLHYRGVHQPALQTSILRATGGHPLALSLAATIVGRAEVVDLAAAPEWHLVVHSLVEHLLSEVEDSRLRLLLLERAFESELDEANPATLVNDEENAALFDNLCCLSLLRPAKHGLRLSDEVVALFAGEVRWRHASPRRSHSPRQMRRGRPSGETAPPLSGEPAREISPALPGGGPKALDVARADSIPTNAQVHLTRRERDVLLALARGRTTNRELAAEFVITEGTANLHVKHILSKLGLSRRAQIATWVYSERGELDRPAPEASSRPARQDLAHPANQPGITRANRTPGSKNSSSSCSK